MKKINLFGLLSGEYEPGASDTNVPDFAYSPLNRLGQLYTPIIDRQFLTTGHSKPVWPGGKPFVVCLTHDVDAVSDLNLWQNIRFIKKILKTAPNRSIGESLRLILEHKLLALRGLLGQSDSLCKFENWLDMETKYGAHSTFFFAPDKVNQIHSSDCMYRYDQMINFRNKSVSVAELMRTMDQEGWEIGLHPSWNAHADLDELVYQKEQVENILSHPIKSVRQHFLKYDPQKTHQIQSLAGFKYDSTMGYNDNLSFRRGTSYPFNCFDLNEGKLLPLLQIPLIVQDGAILAPGKGLRLDPQKAVEYILHMASEVREVGGVLSLSWHPHTRHRPAYFDVYSQVLALLARENPWFATVSEIGEWWSSKVDINLLNFTKDLSQSST